MLARVEAIKAALGLPPSVVGAIPIMGAASVALGIDVAPTAKLPAMVSEIETALGLPASPAATEAVPTAAAAAPAAAAPAAAAPAATASKKASNATNKAGSSAGGSSSSAAESFLPTPSGNVQAKVTATKGLAKFVIRSASLKAITARQDEGDAVPYEEILEQEADEVVKLPSEKKAPEPTPQPLYACDGCSRVFNTAVALVSHRTWRHPSKQRSIFPEPKAAARPPFQGKLSAKLSVVDGVVGCTIRINGKDREQLAREAAEIEEAAAKQEAEREAEARRRADERRRAREREEAVDHVEQRRGSAHRHQYSYAEKVRLLEVLDEINANGSIRNKGEAFEADPRRHGCPYKTVHKWTSALERRKIAVAEAREHAKSLLRFDKFSRSKGKYAAMEKKLFRVAPQLV